MEDANFDVVKILKNLAFIFVFIPILIIALEKLDIDSITVPATNMLNKFMSAVPAIIFAAIILVVAVFGGKLLKGILKDLLNSLKVNDLTQKLGLQSVLGATNLVNVISNLVFVFVIYIGIVEASKILGLGQISEILNTVLAVAAKVVFGLVILALGNVVANFATKVFMSGENTNKLMKSIVKGAILMIFLAMGLSAMGIASNIIELAFGLGLGAIAVAFALAFGLGGKDAAGEEVKDFFNKLKKKD